MKNILTIIILSFLFSCKAQTIVPLASDSDMTYKSGTYNKDVDNDFDKYVGTWKYQQGNTSLKIIFKKITFDHFVTEYKNYYQDILVGEYQYIENGIEKVNTLQQMITQPNNTSEYNISGNLIWTKNLYPKCSECDENERRIKLFISDPLREYLSNAIILRYKNENGTEKIIAKILKNGTSFMPPDNAPDEMRIPYGEYVLIKQP
ncbi:MULTISPECIES: DUF6705 family protein [unclassified Flavobacterium]|uniref:DUF6705 family protein n=1 Tax=unclassified Flavobacterium TaxID=196869 RepID=UPI001ACD0F6D|nr:MULTISPECIES: DUF6705 family protein [unclassified Flavobacterium]MBN9282824.1 hypothetical protein [Flavobacterium sp.]